MPTDKGWIKIHRKIRRSAAFQNPTVGWVWVNLLLEANWERSQLLTGEWLEAGDLIIGQAKFADSIGVTRQNLRTALSNLEKCKNLTIRSTKHGTHITICNYSSYQNSEIEANQQLTNSQPTANQQLTNSQPQNKKERSKEVKKERNRSIARPANIDEVRQHWKAEALQGDPDAFWDFYESKGWMVGKNQMKRWRRAASGWSRRSKDNGPARQSTQAARRENNENVLKRFMERHSDGDTGNSDEIDGTADGNLAQGQQRLICGDLFAGDG